MIQIYASYIFQMHSESIFTRSWYASHVFASGANDAERGLEVVTGSDRHAETDTPMNTGLHKAATSWMSASRGFGKVAEKMLKPLGLPVFSSAAFVRLRCRQAARKLEQKLVFMCLATILSQARRLPQK